MKVHVGLSRKKIFLQRDEPETDILITKGLLESRVSSVSTSLHILLDSHLDIFHVLLNDSALESLPGLASLHKLDVRSVELARILALKSMVTYYTGMSVI